MVEYVEEGLVASVNKRQRRCSDGKREKLVLVVFAGCQDMQDCVSEGVTECKAGGGWVVESMTRAAAEFASREEPGVRGFGNFLSDNTPTSLAMALTGEVGAASCVCGEKVAGKCKTWLGKVFIRTRTRPFGVLVMPARIYRRTTRWTVILKLGSVRNCKVAEEC